MAVIQSNPIPPDNVAPFPSNPYVEAIQARLAAVELSRRAGGGDGMDPWQTSVETRLGQLHSDFSGLSSKLDTQADRLNDKIDNRFFWLLGAMGAGFVSMLGLYLKLSDQVGDIAKAVAAIHH